MIIIRYKKNLSTSMHFKIEQKKKSSTLPIIYTDILILIDRYINSPLFYLFASPGYKQKYFIKYNFRILKCKLDVIIYKTYFNTYIAFNQIDFSSYLYIKV